MSAHSDLINQLAEAKAALGMIKNLLTKQAGLVAFSTDANLTGTIPQHTKNELLGIAQTLTQRSHTLAETALVALEGVEREH